MPRLVAQGSVRGQGTDHVFKVKLSLGFLPSQRELALLWLLCPRGGSEGSDPRLGLRLPLLLHHVRPQQCLDMDGEVSPEDSVRSGGGAGGQT